MTQRGFLIVQNLKPDAWMTSPSSYILPEGTPADRVRIGAHMSVAGAVANAVERAVLHGCEAMQVFTKNSRQLLGKPLDPADVRTFRRRIDETGITPVVSHASYLINLATASPVLRPSTLTAFIDELDRAHALGLLGVVIHPGVCTTGTEEAGLRLIADAIRTAFKARPRRKTMVLLEHTAGQGRTLGYRFEHLAAIINHVNGSPRVGVCLDTCHLVASGYDIVSESGYRDTFVAFDRMVGFGRLKVFHGNDSKRPCGSRVDRHEHIGQGCLGLATFRRLLHDRRFSHLPVLIETEKSATTKPDVIAIDPYDMRNLNTLRSLRDEAGPARTIRTTGTFRTIRTP
jgi:deoxyribonuclease-4